MLIRSSSIDTSHTYSPHIIYCMSIQFSQQKYIKVTFDFKLTCQISHFCIPGSTFHVEKREFQAVWKAALVFCQLLSIVLLAQQHANTKLLESCFMNRFICVGALRFHLIRGPNLSIPNQEAAFEGSCLFRE